MYWISSAYLFSLICRFFLHHAIAGNKQNKTRASSDKEPVTETTVIVSGESMLAGKVVVFEFALLTDEWFVLGEGWTY